MKILYSIMLIALFQFSSNFQSMAQEADENDNKPKKRTAQVTFVPGFGTSGGIQDSVTNKLSFNICLGMEHSLDGLEFGLIYNYDKYFAKGLQVGGFGNSVGGSVHGLQLAGFVNTAGSEVHGAQISGFTNHAIGSIRGGQVTGFLNLSNDSIHGGQVAGFANVSKKKVKGAQVAGFTNIADSVSGAQVAGFLNVGKEIKGGQVAGFLNVAKHVNGSQIALINIADSVNEGVTIGVFNFIKTGIVQPSIRYNEVFDGNLFFASGTKNLYTIMFVGFQFQDSASLWTYGGGLGAQFNVSKRWKFNLEATAQHINPSNDVDNTLNLLNKLSIDFGLEIARHFSITAGPSINVYVTKKIDQETNSYIHDIGLKTFYDSISEGLGVRVWLGYNVALRF